MQRAMIVLVQGLPQLEVLYLMISWVLRIHLHKEEIEYFLELSEHDVSIIPSPPLALDFFAEDMGELPTIEVTSEPNPLFLAGERADKEAEEVSLQDSTFPLTIPDVCMHDDAPPPSPEPRFAGENIGKFAQSFISFKNY